MAAISKNKQIGRQQNKNHRRVSGEREYAELLYGHKRKATHSPNTGNTDYKRVTRAKGKNSNVSDSAAAARKQKSQNQRRKQSENFSSKIPLPQNNPNSRQSPRSKEDKNSVSQSNNPKINQVANEVHQEMVHDSHSSPAFGGEDEAEPSAEASLTIFLRENGLNSGDPPPSVQLPEGANIDLLRTLAFMNQRLKKLDTLETMNGSLKGEIARVQSQVGEVSGQVTTINSDLKRARINGRQGMRL